MKLENLRILALLFCVGLSAAPLLARSESTDVAGQPPAERMETTTGGAGLPALPEAIASFGAVVLDEHLYVYGGHIGRTHQHSVQNLSTGFHRLDLSQPGAEWEALGAVEGLQGTALVAHGREVCRIGGLSALNQQDDPEEDLVSVDSARCFDVDTKQWRDLPALPAPRSSHDAVAHEGKVYVVGGWGLFGKEGGDGLWYDRMLVLDLTDPAVGWIELPQPFERRALAVASSAGRLAVFGGLDAEGTSRAAHAFDPSTKTWSELDPVPEVGGLEGFGVSAIGVGDRIALSGASGKVHWLDEEGTWRPSGLELEQRRFFHRLVASGSRLIAIAGASREAGHLADLEVLGLEGSHLESSDPGAVVGEGGVAEAPATVLGHFWPAFRGRGDGVAEVDALPLEWSDATGLAWRVTLPGFGQSSPVVGADRVFVTAVEGSQKETLVVTALDLVEGSPLWTRRFEASQQIEASDMVSQGAPTPVLDGSGRLFVFWESGDLVALDAEGGEPLWHRSLTDEFGRFEGNHGVGSSPVLAAGSLVVQVTHEGPSYLIALDPASGTTRWKTDRPAKVSWTTPAVVEGAGGVGLLVSAGGRVEWFDAVDGSLRWQVEGFEKNHVPSPMVDVDLAIVPSSAAGHNVALRLGGLEGTTPEVVWRAEGVTSGFGSPIVAGGCVLFANKAGAVSCVARETGEVLWKHRLADHSWASPIRAGDRVYYFTKEGVTSVLRPDREGPHPLAENTLAIAGTVYGVAALEGAFLLRTGGELIKVVGIDPAECGGA